MNKRVAEILTLDLSATEADQVWASVAAYNLPKTLDGLQKWVLLMAGGRVHSQDEKTTPQLDPSAVASVVDFLNRNPDLTAAAKAAAIRTAKTALKNKFGSLGKFL